MQLATPDSGKLQVKFQYRFRDGSTLSTEQNVPLASGEIFNGQPVQAEAAMPPKEEVQEEEVQLLPRRQSFFEKAASSVGELFGIRPESKDKEEEEQEGEEEEQEGEEEVLVEPPPRTSSRRQSFLEIAASSVGGFFGLKPEPKGNAEEEEEEELNSAAKVLENASVQLRDSASGTKLRFQYDFTDKSQSVSEIKMAERDVASSGANALAASKQEPAAAVSPFESAGVKARVDLQKTNDGGLRLVFIYQFANGSELTSEKIVI